MENNTEKIVINFEFGHPNLKKKKTLENMR